MSDPRTREDVQRARAKHAELVAVPARTSEPAALDYSERTALAAWLQDPAAPHWDLPRIAEIVNKVLRAVDFPARGEPTTSEPEQGAPGDWRQAVGCAPALNDITPEDAIRRIRDGFPARGEPATREELVTPTLISESYRGPVGCSPDYTTGHMDGYRDALYNVGLCYVVTRRASP